MTPTPKHIAQAEALVRDIIINIFHQKASKATIREVALKILKCIPCEPARVERKVHAGMSGQ